MNRHKIAMKFSLQGVTLLEHNFKAMIEDKDQESQIDEQEVKRIASLLATALHNVGVESEHLADIKNTQKFYLKAFAIANKYLGKDHVLSKLANESWCESRKKIMQFIENKAQERSR